METRTDGQQGRGLAPVLLILAVVLALRLPFLNQAVQGDDVYYLAGAEHAQIEPLHPNHFQYLFLGDKVDMRGHPHPPFNAWFLGLLLALMGDIREAPFHAAYILFSIVAALAMWSLARRFSLRPLWATLLFLAVPAFVVNGNSFEADVPFLAFWMSAIALFIAAVWGRLSTCGRVANPPGAGLQPARRILSCPTSTWFLILSAGPAALAAMTGFQAIFLTPILLAYLWLTRTRWRAAWAAAFVPVFVIALWQVFARFTTGSLPAGVLSGHMQTYGLQALQNKLLNAAALSVHLCFIVFPLLLPAMVVVAFRRRHRGTVFLAVWIAIFFAGAVAVFFAGSARYLLPIAAPMALLASKLRARWLAPAFACQMALSIALAVVNYQHWDGYRRFAASLAPQIAAKRVWINGEWGLRFYMEALGGLTLERGRAVRPGEIVVSSALGYPIEFTTGGGALTPIAEIEIRPSLPLRLIGIDAKSGYSTATKGLRPFDVSAGPVDRLRADLVVERKPTLEYLSMNAPEAANQIVSGLYALEGGAWRWMSRQAMLLLKAPSSPARLRATVTIPTMAPARKVTLALDGNEVAARTVTAPGSYVIETASPVSPAGESAVLSITIDQVFSVAGDHRELGVIVSEAGFGK